MGDPFFAGMLAGFAIGIGFVIVAFIFVAGKMP
jgi:hypothetical protein